MNLLHKPKECIEFMSSNQLNLAKVADNLKQTNSNRTLKKVKFATVHEQMNPFATLQHNIQSCHGVEEANREGKL
jgi:hypothetical protein